MQGAQPPADGSGASDQRSQGPGRLDGPGPGWPLTGAHLAADSTGHEVPADKRLHLAT